MSIFVKPTTVGYGNYFNTFIEETELKDKVTEVYKQRNTTVRAIQTTKREIAKFENAGGPEKYANKCKWRGIALAVLAVALIALAIGGGAIAIPAIIALGSPVLVAALWTGLAMSCLVSLNAIGNATCGAVIFLLDARNAQERYKKSQDTLKVLTEEAKQTKKTYKTAIAEMKNAYDKKPVEYKTTVDGIRYGNAVNARCETLERAIKELSTALEN